MRKSIITVVGKDRVGIIASVCIVDGFFNMMMITDTNNADVEFLALSQGLEELGTSMGCIIKLQREDIFNQMQRI